MVPSAVCKDSNSYLLFLIISLFLPTLRAGVKIQKHIDVVAVNMSLLFCFVFIVSLKEEYSGITALTVLKRNISPSEESSLIKG